MLFAPNKLPSYLCMAALLLCIFLCPTSGQASVRSQNTPALTDFRQIPGITQEEIEAIEQLQKTRHKLSYGMLGTSETFLGEDGRYGGYSALVCAWLSQLFGIEFYPEIYDWQELITLFDKGEIDFTGELTATPERRKRYLMTDTFTERAVVAFRVKGGKSLGEINMVRPIKFAFLRGTTTIDIIVSSSIYQIKPVLVENEQEAINLLYGGQVDGFVAEEHGSSNFGDDVMAEPLFPVVYSPISLATTRSELKPLIDVFDKYLRNCKDFHLITLYNQGHEDYLRHRLYSSLTAKERKYLIEHREGGKKVLIAAESDTYPCSFYNKQENQWQGTAIDVLRRVRTLTGLDFAVVNKPGAVWQDVFELLQTGQADMITELIHTPEREGKYLWASSPYSVDYFALLSTAEHDDININQVVYSKVGLINGTAYAEVFRQWFPDHQTITLYPDAQSAFDSLERGEIELLMASRNLLLTATNYHEKPGYKANLIFDRTYQASFGFGPGQEELCSIVSKAQNLIDTTLIAERWTRKVFDYRGKMARAQVPYLVGLSILLLCVLGLVSVILVRNRAMKKQLEETVVERTAELLIQTENARLASQAKGDFLSRMSHEIRTPLNAIIGMAQIARQTAITESPKTIKSIDEMITASAHLLSILNDVLDMSKIEAGKFSLANEPFCLASCMRDVSSIITQRCHEKSIDFEGDFDSLSHLHVIGDELRLKQVLINLLGNAVKFTSAGGKIELRVGVQDTGSEEVGLDFTVSDTGIGMSEEQMSKLFTAFEQADSSIASRFGGTGLGLAISQNLVNQMGGMIKVSSEPGIGTTFAFSLQLPKTEPAQESPTQHNDLAENLDLSGKRILLVEDILVNRMVIMELLESTGVSFDEAADGQEAVDIFAASSEGYYDLIFMDIQMPCMDGYQAAQAIRSMQRNDAGSIPIIAMTANAYREDIEKALAAGMNGHISKPVDIEVVRRMLAETFMSKA